MQKMCLVLCFKQHTLKCERNYLFGMHMYFFLSGHFLTSIIILLIFIRGVHGERMEEKKENKKRKR